MGLLYDTSIVNADNRSLLLHLSLCITYRSYIAMNKADYPDTKLISLKRNAIDTK